MQPFDFAQSFIERASAASPAALAAAFEETVQRLGFRYFACCSHVDPLRLPRGAVMIQNYPDEWTRSYSARRLHEIDPVFLHASRSLLPFSWDAPKFKSELTHAQQSLLAEAASLGLRGGYTIPIHLPWSSAPPASCSIVPDSKSLSADSYLAVRLMAMHLYDVANREPGDPAEKDRHGRLTRRERQCLELAAQGKSDWTVGQLLNLSEHTVHGHIERAKRRFGVATRVQAVVYALRCRQISFGDVIRAEADDAVVEHHGHPDEVDVP